MIGAEATSKWAEDAWVPSWPAGEDVALESTPPSPTRFRLLSSGTIMGPAGEIAALLTSAMSQFGEKRAATRGFKWGGVDQQALIASYTAER